MSKADVSVRVGTTIGKNARSLCVASLCGMAAVVAALLVGGCRMFGESGAAAAGIAYVDSFDLAGATCGMGKRVQAGKTVDGNALTVAGKTYEHGIGTHPESAVLCRANGKVQAFDALVAIDDDAKTAGSGKSYGKPTAQFKVWADGRVVW